MIRFTILGKPVSHKNGYRIVTIGSRPAIVKSKEALTYERDALKQIPPSARQRLEGPVSVTLRIFYESERPDLDESIVLDLLQDRWERPKAIKGEGNAAQLMKALGEWATRPERVLVQAGVYRNDRQVREKHVFHGIDKRNPRVEVAVEPMQAQQPELELAPRAVSNAEFFEAQA